MSDTLLVSPLLDGMLPEGPLPEGSGVFRVRHQSSGRSLMVKRISIPESPADTEALLLTGAVTDAESATAYYLSVADRIRQELKQLRALAGGPYFCSYLRFQAVAKEGTPGLDLYLLAPCRTSLREYLLHNAISQQKAVQLALDLCHALVVLRRSGYVHQDLKPENIFLENGHFCIGDFGLVACDDLRFASLPARLAGQFTAPELHSVTGTLNQTIDIYAVGMMLYYIFNGNHVPFEEAGSTEKTADSRRLAGEPLPTPLYADYELDTIIRKACAHRPEDRYQTPEALLAALQDYVDRNPLCDESIVPPIYTGDPLPQAGEDAPEAPAEEPDDAPETDDTPLRITDVESLSEDFRESFAPAHEEAAEPKKKKRKRWIPILLAVLAVLGAAFCYFYFEYSAITVTDIAITDKGTDYLTVSVTASDLDNLMITCASEDGTYTKTYFCQESLTFFELQSGTAYRLTVDSVDWHYVKGAQEETAATSALTEILSFDTQTQDDGSVLVTFQVSGPEPAQWTLHCVSSTAEETTWPVENRTCTLTGLLPNSVYTLSLEAESGFYLGGTTEITYSYSLPITGSNLREESVTRDAISVVWDSDSTVATEWKAVCSGDNGYASTIITDSCRAVFTDTAVGAVYTIAVSNSTMTMPMLLTVQSNVCDIASFTAEESEDGIKLEWKAEGSLIPETWTLSYGPTGVAPRTVAVTGSSTELTDLIPNAEYTFSLTASAETSIGGTTEITAQTADTGEYTDHDFGGIFIALYEKPDQAWSAGTLGEAKSTFAAKQAIVCAIQPTETPQVQADPETIDVLLVIRNSAGQAVGFSTESHNWNELWNNGVFAAAIDDVPEDAGTYKMELYFNRQLLRTAEFTVE